MLAREVCPTLAPRLVHVNPTRNATACTRPQVSAQDAREVVGVVGTNGGCRTVRIAFDRLDLLVFVSRHATHDPPGSTDLITPARVIEGARIGAQFNAVTAQVHVVSDLLFERLSEGCDETGPEGTLVVDSRLVQDPAIERLAQMLSAIKRPEQDLGAIWLAIVALLLEMHGNRSVSAAMRRRKTGLPKWRLKRVVTYVDTNLAECIRLADLAQAAGLTRMHFAAQFRVAMGMRPHDYVLRRRIERAQELLRDLSQPLVDVALSVGFQTQAHFATVFRRFTGETPHRWRHSIPETVKSVSAPPHDPMSLKHRRTMGWPGR
jgi:AraC-like DNA-binding protein